jgi:alpha-ketoglutarate-dependent 2,4-dichlorophenoxyacetate dioxygenase
MIVTIGIEPLHPLYAARLTGVDIRRPVDEATMTEVRAALATYVVCVIGHDEPPTNEEHIAFSARLGPLERGKSPKINGTEVRLPYPEIVDQSNLNDVGEIYADEDRRLAYKRANRLWHTDMSFYEVRATYSLLVGHITPDTGADTEFTDMRAVWDELPEARKAELKDLVVEHSYWYSRVQGGGPEPTEEERVTRPPARHKLAHMHAPSGRKALYLASHASDIVGYPRETARALIKELMDFAVEPRFVYAHKWRRGDVLIWDNLATMHRATPFDDRNLVRDMRRTTCREKRIETCDSRIT